jgi:hypothetical protein
MVSALSPIVPDAKPGVGEQRVREISRRGIYKPMIGTWFLDLPFWMPRAEAVHETLIRNFYRFQIF